MNFEDCLNKPGEFERFFVINYSASEGFADKLGCIDFGRFFVIHCLFRHRVMEGNELTGVCTVCQVKLINLNSDISSDKIVLIES